MSEYWKSTPKYWCKHCNTYVKDTPFEKKQHEATGKHQGSLKRFLRDIQNNHEKDEREKQQVKAEVQRLTKKFGSSTSSSSDLSRSAPKSGSSSTPQAFLADRKRQLAQLVEMGVAVPDEERGDLAVAGQWKIIAQEVVNEAPEESLSVGVRKRKHEDKDEEEEAGETVVRRGWGSTTKRYPGEVVADLDDLFTGGRKVKVKKSSPQAEPLNTTDEPGSTEHARLKEEPDVVEKKEEDSELQLEKIPPIESVPVFKKRRPKALAT